ncbi:MAG TPA: hypothetical protein VE733_01065 [Streptosporangiaceae bacterium]|jgi:hypothetical protein|nr:hypothetical protein [Streptosporangiaceae bacterium]
MQDAVGRERDADLTGLPLVSDQLRGRVFWLVIVAARVERHGLQVQHPAAQLARQGQEPWQVQRIGAEADLRPVVVLRDGRHDHQVIPRRELGDRGSQACKVLHVRHRNPRDRHSIVSRGRSVG